MTLLFGIYPGGVVGDDTGGLTGGPPDDPERVAAALDLLQGRAGRPFLVRAYAAFDDSTRLGGPHPTDVPADAARYAERGRGLDLVAQYRSASGDVAGYCAFVRELLGQYGPFIDSLQVAEEPNVTSNPLLDGYYPRVGEAIVRGVAAARARVRELGLTRVRIGVNTTPLFGPTADFLAELTAQGGPDFAAALDYVGLDFFPDVFRPLPSAGLREAVAGLLRHHRHEVMARAGLAHLPLHITEHGWPTGPDRPADRQAEVVETVVTTVATHAEALGLSGYTHFCLRDSDSAEPGLFHRFGLMTDDYTPKPAFATLRTLIDRFAA